MNEVQRLALGFGLELQKLLIARGIGSADLTRMLLRAGHHPEAAIENVLLNKAMPPPSLINAIARVLNLEPGERYQLHRTAAIDRGYDLIMPEPPTP